MCVFSLPFRLLFSSCFPCELVLSAAVLSQCVLVDHLISLDLLDRMSRLAFVLLLLLLLLPFLVAVVILLIGVLLLLPACFLVVVHYVGIAEGR